MQPAADNARIELGVIATLFATLKVELGADGSMRIEAPPAAASALAALFLGIARLLSATVPLSGASPRARNVLSS